MSHFLNSLIKFSVGLIFILMGIMALLVPWSPQVRTSLVDWILQSSLEMWLFGIAFLLIGLYLVIFSLWHSKTRYYNIQIDNPSIQISETVVQDYLSTYWKSLFPLNEIPCSVEMRKRKIAILADLPFIPLDDRPDLIQQIQNDLSEIFREHLGYEQGLDIKVSFQKAK